MVTYSSPVSFLAAFKRQPRPGGVAAPPLVGAFSVANNHSADMGPDGCVSACSRVRCACSQRRHSARCTLAALDAEGMAHSGIRLNGSELTWCDFKRAVIHSAAA